MKKLFGIKTTKHTNYYRLYILWLPYMKIKFQCNLIEIYLLGIKIACVKTIYPQVDPTILKEVATMENLNNINKRALEIIAKHQDSDYIKEVK